VVRHRICWCGRRISHRLFWFTYRRGLGAHADSGHYSGDIFFISRSCAYTVPAAHQFYLWQTVVAGL